MPHFIVSLENSIAHGIHTIHAAEIQAALGTVLTMTFWDGHASNESTEPARWLLVRLWIFWVEKIIKGVHANTGV